MQNPNRLERDRQMRRTGDLKLIQELNRSIILDTIRQSGPISRSQIAKRNKLSPTTVTSAVNELIQEGLVCEEGIGVSSGGRKPILLRFSPDSQFLIGVSVSNSSITIAEMNLEAKIRRKEIHTIESYMGDSVGDYVLGLINHFIERYSDLELCVGISVITQGVVDSVNGIIRYNSKLKLKNMPLKEMVEKRFNIKTWLDNDTNAYILAEKNFGQFHKYENILYITIGDGLGAGILVNGSLYRGSTGGAGEFGHTSITREGIRCDCGNIGCLENYVSWPAIYSRIFSSITRGRQTVITELCAEDMSRISPSLFREALKMKDPLALDILEETASYLSVGLVNLVHLFNPEVIILGGDVVHDNPILLEKVTKSASQRVLAILSEDLEIRPTSLGGEFEMIGAAAILLQDKFQFSLT
jgi:predicted NBD/HSP70 family sugar kinase